MHTLAFCFPGFATMLILTTFMLLPVRKEEKKPNDSILGHMQPSKGHLESDLIIATTLLYCLLKDPFSKLLSI